MKNKIKVDEIISPKWILTVENENEILEDYSIVIKDSFICDLVKNSKLSHFLPTKITKLNDHIVLPGLINLHTHAAMSLFRGFADDMKLADWLEKKIWPAESQYVSKDFVFDGTYLACCEMIRSGVTCFNDMYFFPEAAALASLKAKMRVSLGITLIEFPTSYANDAKDYLTKGLETRDKFKEQEIISFCLAPHAPYTVSNKSFESINTLSNQLSIPVHVHLHETKKEIQDSIKEFGVSPIQRLSEIGLLSPNLIAVHCVHLSKIDLNLLGQEACSVAHCPTSNLKLGSGFSEISQMLQYGINVGLGTDGSASNNKLDILSEMKIASLVAKGLTHEADSLNAYETIKMATINSAKALGLENKIGSIKKGKKADIIAIDSKKIQNHPIYNPISHIVNVFDSNNVSDVWINGIRVLCDKKFTTIDEDLIRNKVKFWQKKIG